MDFEILKYIAGIVGLPAAGAAGWTMTVARKAFSQAKRDIHQQMVSGLISTKSIIQNATPQQVTSAKQEAYPGRGKPIAYKTTLVVPKSTAANLLAVQARLDTVLNLNGVFLNPVLRRRVTTLRDRMSRGQNYFSTSKKDEYHLGRVLRINALMEQIRKSVK